MFKELTTQAHNMELSIANQGNTNFLVFGIKKEKDDFDTPRAFFFFCQRNSSQVFLKSKKQED